MSKDIPNLAGDHNRCCVQRVYWIHIEEPLAQYQYADKTVIGGEAELNDLAFLVAVNRALFAVGGAVVDAIRNRQGGPFSHT